MQAAAYLRQKTQGLHQQTEAVALGREIMDQTLNLDQYRSLISKNHFLHNNLEPLLLNGLRYHHLTDFTHFLHPRMEALRADAHLLELPEINYGVKLPELRSSNEVLGGLYVLLGSNLGGRVIYKALKENLQLRELPDFHFYGSSGNHPAKEWPQFCRMLDSYLLSESDLAGAKLGAEAVFRLVRDVHATPAYSES
ncbi:biliverdin-producing heme oxygenase [Flavilitoribacter nigricans]|uniref:Heme oxygenase n=1 Tax=Flavilitoribacter nigricans (strain ATCC 23147 / DSM 23189 / NBRC 102662 / NCIMB 1420 / SS-2) TaxID=1122177 RepID=A0A2D0NC64_FLAN2|nr:biliverdin-producing heme oxygenase [Flavilitoribacter nigricans]PHN05353.1 hypothetical protein CRP01_17720 [Flavilitoribacter nigricans DSM 23189 = NBRC 102662]